MNFFRRRVRLVPFLASAFALCGLAACRVPRSVYGPTSNNVATAPNGQPAAVYDVSFGRSKGGQIQVWSDGVVSGRGRDVTQTASQPQPRAFRVGFLLRNDSDSQLTLQPSDARLRFEDLPDLTPREHHLVSVEPHQSAEVLLEYPLPGRFAERPPDSYEVAWTVQFGKNAYRQTTTFNRDVKRGIVPRPLDSSSQPPDQPYLQGTNHPEPIGFPFGSDPNQ